MARRTRNSDRRHRMIVFAAAVFALLITAGAFSFVKSPTVAPDHPVAAPQPEEPVQAAPQLVYEGAADAAALSQMWIYGTHLGMTGTLVHPQAEQVLRFKPSDSQAASVTAVQSP